MHQQIGDTIFFEKDGDNKESLVSFIQGLLGDFDKGVQKHYSDVSAAKTAALGGDPSQKFEEDVATLGYAFIKDKAPSLMDYMAGFQLLKSNEDNTRAVGVFVFDVGGEWVMIPVFFINGELQGHELLRLHEQAQFVPTKESWVNFVLSKKPSILGEGIDESKVRDETRTPNLTQFIEPKGIGKFGIRQLQESLPAIHDMVEKLAYTSLSENKSFMTASERLQLPNLCEKSLPLCKTAAKTMEHYPGFAKACYDAYGDDFLVNALQKHAKEQEERDSVFLLGEHKVNLEPTSSDQEKVTIVTQTSSDNHSIDWLTSDDKEEIVAKGFKVFDQRDPWEVSVNYGDTKPDLVSPTDPGIYDILSNTGEFERAFITNKVGGAFDTRQSLFLTYLPDSKQVGVVTGATLLSNRLNNEKAEFQKWYEGLSKKSLPQGSDYEYYRAPRYMIVTEKMEATLPFAVRKKIDDSTYSVVFDCEYDMKWDDRLADSVTYTSGELRGNFSGAIKHSSQPSIIVIRDKEDSCMELLQNTLYIPKEHKVIQLSTREEEEVKPFIPGTVDHVQSMLMEKLSQHGAEQLELFHTGDEVWFNESDPRPPFKAFCDLIEKKGFREKTARDMLKKAEVNFHNGRNSAKFRVKYAALPDPTMVQTLAAPFMDNPTIATDNSIPGGIRRKEDFEQQGVVPSLQVTDNSLDEQSMFEDPPLPGGDVIRTVEQAAQQGKDVFDVGALSVLLENTNDDQLIREYLGDFMGSLDKLGTLLFQYYWHRDRFQDRFGDANAKELEDSLRNTFEILGDLCLFLRRRDIAPSISGGLGGPDISDAANI